MWRKVTLPLQGIFIYFGLWIPFMFDVIKCLPATAVRVNVDPVEVRRLVYSSDRSFKKRRTPDSFMHLPRSEYYDDQESVFSEEDSFFMGPEDAVTENKYSPPIIAHQQESHTRYRSSFIPLKFLTGHQDASSSNIDQHSKSVNQHIQGTINTRRIHTVPATESVYHEVTVTSDYKVIKDIESDVDDIRPIDRKQRQSESSIEPHLRQNNFTDVNDSHVLVPSDAVLQYQPHPVIASNDTPKDIKRENKSATTSDVPSFVDSDSLASRNAVIPVDSKNDQPTEQDIHTNYKTLPTIDFVDPNTTTDRTIYYFENQTFSAIASETTLNSSDVLPSVESTKTIKLSTGTVAGIVIGVITCFTLLSSSVIYLLYRRYNGKCTGVAEGKFNSDNCGYLDDSLRSSVYLNNHIELPKENSEEMTSLDNDSFLNSLETMTIQNYWADSTKNTKV